LVWKPGPHVSAIKHATGEAVYCDDIPKIENELVMELVLSRSAHAYLKQVDPSKSLKIDGVVGFVSCQDLEPHRNRFGVIIKDEEIFASEKVWSATHSL